MCGQSGDTLYHVITVMFRRQLRAKGRTRVPIKSKDWVVAKKERRRRQGKYVVSAVAMYGKVFLGLQILWILQLYFEPFMKTVTSNQLACIVSV